MIPNTRSLILFIILVLSCQISFGQVATIQDADGWTNVRIKPDANSEVILKVYENQVFWYYYDDENNDNEWASVLIPKNKFCLKQDGSNYLSGFIHKSRILPLEKLDVSEGSNFTFQINIRDFDPTNRIIDRTGENYQWVVAIDGRPFWGTDGGLPSTQVADIKVTINGREIDIHEVFYSDIYECSTLISLYKNGDTYFVHHPNGDAAGYYEIVWVLGEDGLKQRLVGRGYY